MVVPIKRQSIIPRVDGIQRDMEKLRSLSELPPGEFAQEDNFIRAQFYLRRVLEGIFHIAAHLTSHKGGNRSTQYKEVARSMAEAGLIDKNFAEQSLVKMAGYRNRLTHFYADVTPEELHHVLLNNINDVSTFLKQVKEILEHPNRFDLQVE